MLKTSLNLQSIFSSKLLSITLAHSKHVAHASTAKESTALLLVGAVCTGLTCLLSSVQLAIAPSINLEEESQEHGSYEYVHNLGI